MISRRNFLILSGILILFVSSSAVQKNNIKLYTKEVEVDAGDSLLIPCHYELSGSFQRDNIELEWGMVPEQGGNYKPIYSIYGNSRQRSHQFNDRAHVYLSRHNNNCTLVIDPIQIEDSGTYRIHLTSNGVRFRPITDVKVHVKTCIESFGSDYCTCDEVQVKGTKMGLDQQTILLIGASIAGGLLLLAVIGCFIIYVKKKTV